MIRFCRGECAGLLSYPQEDKHRVKWNGFTLNRGDSAMKRFMFVCLFLLVLYTMYYDLRVGTLPYMSEATPASVQSEAQEEESAHVKKVKIAAGQTVLSVVEHLNQSVEVSIEKIVADFKRLNPGVNPNDIQTGKVYAFPIYSESIQ
jgi:hypothetical protein